MPEDGDLQARVKALEETLAGGDHRQRKRPRWMHVVLIGLLVVAVVGPNVWLWLTFQRLRSERTKEHLFWVLCQPGFTDEQRRQAFAELLWQGNREWRSARLARLDLTGIHLAGANIQSAYMEGCKLAGADLSRSVLSHSQLNMADLSRADLTGAELYETTLLKADLRDATLSATDLTGADLGQCTATNAKFASANMTGARLDLADLTGADLRLAKLVEADLHLANLSSTNLFRADLSGANLNRANLSNANWWQAQGLTSEFIADFKQRFAPAEDANPVLKQDFQKWLAQQQPKSTAPSNELPAADQ